MIIVIVIINNNPSTIWLGFLTPMQCVTGREKICLPPPPPSAMGNLSKHINQGLRVEEDKCSRSPAAPPCCTPGRQQEMRASTLKAPPAPNSSQLPGLSTTFPWPADLQRGLDQPSPFPGPHCGRRSQHWLQSYTQVHTATPGLTVKPGASHFTLRAFLFSFLQNGADNIFGGCYKEF